jgi:spore coat polysaccharide biosynthesis predicted glycosyltransferase SpsG
MNDKQKTVLFCPLDWGLGHIARDLPLIRAFHKKGYRVIVAASTTLTNWLTTEFPDVDTTLFEGPEIKYSKSRFLLPNSSNGLLKKKNTPLFW